MKVTVIGVAGGTGSGKSTLVKRLQEAFVGDDVVTLCHDYYYKAHPELTYEERTKLNYDHPQAFDTQMLVDHIKALKDNVPIEHPVYSFVDHDRTAETVCVKPSKVIIVDGILIFENKELRDMMDIKVYVDTDADIRLARRILREGAPAVKDYLQFLSGGCSKSPIDLLRGAGVDMSTTKPVEDALALFGELLDEMEALVDD